IDYFLTSNLMEPPDAEAHYTERLVRLPNLSGHYEPLNLAPVTVTRAEHGLRPHATVFWCAHMMSKFLPQYDDVFARIARRVGDCQFVFAATLRSAEIAVQFRDRLVGAFAARGLDCDVHCVFLPVLPLHEFIAVEGLSDVFLDTI